MKLREIVLGVVRHILTAGGGVLVARGVATSSEVEAAAGAAVVLIGFVWSVLQKVKAAEKE